MTVGPMPCMTCGRRVWYDHGRMLSRYWGQWRTHSCRLGLAHRHWMAAQPHQTREARRAYKAEWRRRKRAAA